MKYIFHNFYSVLVMVVFSLPTFLTILRIIMVPFFTLMFYLPIYWGPILCAFIFFIAAITDWFDGFLARRWQQTTAFGKFLDPVADKIMIIAALILVSEYFHVWWVTLPISSIIIREIIISALREWIARIDKSRYVPIAWISKIKTCTQMLALTVLLCRFNEWIILTGITILYLSALLTLWSMCYYLYIVYYVLCQCKF